MDAEAASIVDETRVARDNAIAVEVAEAERIRPVSTTILERDRGSVGGTEQNDTRSKDAAPQRLAADLVGCGHCVPTIAGMYPGPVTAA
jgi:hypothetical protein